MQVVRRVNHTPCSGGLARTLWADFLFLADSPPVKPYVLLGGATDDTGGSGFEMPYNFFGDSSSSRSFLVLYCSFVDGIDRGIQLPLLYTLKTQFHLSQLAASAAIGVSQSPWLAKPFLALLTDSIPLFEYRRTPYIFISAGLNAVSLALIALASAHHFGGFFVPMALMTLRTFGRAMIDSAAQGLLLEECRDVGEVIPHQARTSVLVSRFQAAHRLGQFLNVCAGGYLLSTASITTVYTSMAVAHLGTMLLSLAADEAPVEFERDDSDIGEIMTKSMTDLHAVVVNNKRFQQVLEYSFLALVVPSYEAPLTYYLLDARHFSLASMSLVNVVQTTGSMLAPLVYAQFFQNSKFSDTMTLLTLVSIPASLMPVLITSGFCEFVGINEVLVAAVS